MRRWRRPLCFTLKAGVTGVEWLVSSSDGVEHVALGEARRVRWLGPRLGTSSVWEPWPVGAEKPLTPPAESLQEAGERLVAEHQRRRGSSEA